MKIIPRQLTFDELVSEKPGNLHNALSNLAESAKLDPETVATIDGLKTAVPTESTFTRSEVFTLLSHLHAVGVGTMGNEELLDELNEALERLAADSTSSDRVANPRLARVFDEVQAFGCHEREERAELVAPANHPANG